jgi:hypothetical protein
MIEFMRYFKAASDDERICMFLNPFVALFGVQCLVDQRFYKPDLLETCKTLVIRDAVKLFGPDKETIYEQVRVEYDALMAKSAAQETAAAAAAPALSLLPVPPGSPAKHRSSKNTSYLLQMRRRMAQSMTTAAGSATAAIANTQAAVSATSPLTLEQRQERRFVQEQKKHKESITQEVEAYLALLHSFSETTGIDDETGEVSINFDKWTDMLANFPSDVAKKEIAEKGNDIAGYWTDNLVPLDSVYSTKRFDIVGWWASVDKKKNGGGLFPTLALLAVVHLAQPYTNAFLERVFSRGTWIDGARSQRILDTIFEMRVLDGNNRKLVELAKPALDLKDSVNKLDTTATSSAIEEAVARFARPLVLPKDPNEESVVVVDERDDDEEESVIGLTEAQVAAAARKDAIAKAKKEAREKVRDKARQEAKEAGKHYETSDDESSVSGGESGDEGEDSDKGDDDKSLFRALDCNEDYHKGIEDVVRSMPSNQKPKPTPESSTAKSSTKKPTVITTKKILK